MEIRDLFVETDAVSSVVSTVLMVAITVILVAVIGSFVLNLGGAAVGDRQPTTSFSITQSNVSCGGNSTIGVTITHEGGDVIDKDQLSVTVDDAAATNCSGTQVWAGSDEVSASDSVTITGDATDGSTSLAPDDRIVVTWRSDGGQKSFILTDYRVENT